MEQPNVKRYKCTVAYDGTSYHGFQIQPDAPTVQEAVEYALARIHKAPVSIVGSGRTDAGVHARGQVFHFDSQLNLEANSWTRAINANLPKDIRIQATEEVSSSFHARYDVVRKEYRYHIYISRLENPLKRLYWHHIPYPLAIKEMQEASKLLVGEHDFTAFSSAKTEIEDKIRTIYRLDIETCQVDEGEELVLICQGNGFLYNMVRIVAGTLIDVGQGKMEKEQVKRALVERDRTLAGKTAPAHGLILWEVFYY